MAGAAALDGAGHLGLQSLVEPCAVDHHAFVRAFAAAVTFDGPGAEPQIEYYENVSCP